MSTTIAVLAELARHAGPDAVRERTDGFAVAGVEPLAVVAPDSVDALAAVLAFCSEAGLAVEPAGAGTWLGAGNAPAGPPVVVSTARLAGLAEYEPADLVVGVHAGMRHDALARDLAANRQVLTLDPPALPGATIGATVSLGVAGPLRAMHRTPRDLLLGVQVVTGDGRLLRFGGRVVKNVAGYDLVRLLAGSRGTLGVLTSMHLLLRSAPASDRTFVQPAMDAAEAAALALAIRDRIQPEALEVVTTAGAPVPAPGDAPWAVLTRLAGSAAAVDEQAGRLAALAPVREVGEGGGERESESESERARGGATGGAAAGAVASGAPHRQAAAGLWDRLAAEEAAAETYVRLAGRPVALAETLEAALSLMAESGGGAGVARPEGSGARGRAGPGADVATGWRVAAHAADGIVRLWREPGAPDLAADRFAAAVEAQRSRLAAGAGTLLCPVLPSALRERVGAPAGDARIAELSAALRRTFDPAGILSAGRHET